MLALNQPEQVQNRANICYFALLPEDEARDTARAIFTSRVGRLLLLLIPTQRWAIAWPPPLPMSGRSWAAVSCCSRNSGSVSELRAGVNAYGYRA